MGGGGGGCKEGEWHISYVESEHSRIFELREQRFLSGMAAIMHENVRSTNSSANDLERNQKAMPKILGDPFRVKSVKNGQLYHILDVRKSLERQASKQFTTNVPKILDLKSSSEQKIFDPLLIRSAGRMLPN